MTYAPGVKCVGLYALSFRDGAASGPRWAVVSFAKPKKLRALYDRHFGPAAEAAATSRPPRAVLLPELGCLVELFPTDWGLPALAMATDPDLAATFLPRLDAGRDPTTPPAESLAIDVWRYKAHRRCVLRFATGPRTAPRDVVGKLYREAARGQRVACTMATLRAHGPGDHVVIPRPLGVVEPWNLLLMERVAGPSMEQELEGR